MATAEQMRRLHPDPPTRHNDYQQAVRHALEWLIEADDWVQAEQHDLSQSVLLMASAGVAIRELLRYGTPGDPE